MEWPLPNLCMVTVPHIMVGLERMLDYRGVELARFHRYNYDSQTLYVYVQSNLSILKSTPNPNILLTNQECVLTRSVY